MMDKTMRSLTVLEAKKNYSNIIFPKVRKFKNRRQRKHYIYVRPHHNDQQEGPKVTAQQFLNNLID
jgi:hypothetical protein